MVGEHGKPARQAIDEFHVPVEYRHSSVLRLFAEIGSLRVERDTLTAQLAELRAAVARAKWAHDEFDPPLPAAYELTAEAELFALVPSDGSWAEQ